MEGSSNFARGMEVMSSFFIPEFGVVVLRFFSPEWRELVGRFISLKWWEVKGTFSYWVWREVVGDRFSSMGHVLAENSSYTLELWGAC